MKRCLLSSLKEYVEAYEPRVGFVHPYEGYDTMGSLGEITSKLHNM
jgi:hypothetical protein